MEYEVWPEHYAALEVFTALDTQWRMGPMGGVIGLDYSAISPTLDLIDVKPHDRRDLFVALRAMERAALKIWQEDQ